MEDVSKTQVRVTCVVLYCIVLHVTRYGTSN